MRKGERTLFWIALPLEMRKDDVPLLKRDAEAFVPAGHVSLNRVDDPSPGIDPSAARVGWVRPECIKLIRSSKLQSLRTGRFAMKECERLAQQEPYGSLNCRWLSLWTLSERYAAGGEQGWDGIGRWERIGMPVPQQASGPWYENLGYVSYKEEIRLHFGLPNEPMVWHGVFLRKELRSQ